LKQEAALTPGAEFPALDLRIADFQELEDYNLDKGMLNAFAISNSHGRDRIFFMAPNSSNQKDWINALTVASKEALLLDQRYTVSLLSKPGAPRFADNLVPDPPLVQLKWPGSTKWQSAFLSIETEKGYMKRILKGKLEQCIYIYEKAQNKACLARLTKLSSVQALVTPSDCHPPEYFFVIEAAGKRKSKKLGGLKIATRVFIRVSTEELRIRWIGILRNCFDITLPESCLAKVPSERITSDGSPSRASFSRTSATSTSSLSINSNQGDSRRFSNTQPEVGMNDRRQWEINGLNSSSQRRFSNEMREDAHQIFLNQQYEEERRRRHYDHTKAYNQMYGTYSDMDYMPAMSMVSPVMYRPSPMALNSYPFSIQPFMPMGFHSGTMPLHSPNRMYTNCAPSHQQLRHSNSYDHGYVTQRRVPPASIHTQPDAIKRSDKGKAFQREFRMILEQIVVLSPERSLLCSLLYDIYERHCKQQDLKAASPEAVQSWMLEAGYTLKKVERGAEPEWNNIALRI
jgi:hypothetical protein